MIFTFWCFLISNPPLFLLYRFFPYVGLFHTCEFYCCVLYVVVKHFVMLVLMSAVQINSIVIILLCNNSNN